MLMLEADKVLSGSEEKPPGMMVDEEDEEDEEEEEDDELPSLVYVFYFLNYNYIAKYR